MTSSRSNPRRPAASPPEDLRKEVRRWRSRYPPSTSSFGAPVGPAVRPSFSRSSSTKSLRREASLCNSGGALSFVAADQGTDDPMLSMPESARPSRDAFRNKHNSSPGHVDLTYTETLVRSNNHAD